MRTITELEKIPRMAYAEMCDNNSVAGLYDMLVYIQRYTYLNLIVEVGSYAGISSELFAQFCKNLICVDIWNFKSGQGIPADQVEIAWQEFEKMKSEYNKITVIKDYSINAADLFSAHEIDLVYIDAKHDYSEVYQDIRAWFPKVKKGGWIAGHDIHMEGVQRAVEEVFEKDYVTFKDTSWLTRKR